MNRRKILQSVLEPADIRLNGDRPWDVRVHNEALYREVFSRGTLGIGEGYMAGWWDCERLDEMFYRAINAHLENRFSSSNLPGMALKLWQSLFNLQSRSRAFEVAETHYNFGNRFFELMLGPSMAYSCGYWRHAHNLDEAQYAKMDLICRKLHLEPGMKVLDIGCGWGSLAMFMVERHKVEVEAISVSAEQIDYAKKKDAAGRVKWLLDDYRSLTGKFDRIVSVGMFEHVGYKNYKVFMKKVYSLLEKNGLFLLHTIGSNHQRKGTDPWINKYIFPNGMLPSEENVTAAFVDYFIMEDWHNFGADYDKTLMAWNGRLEEAWREKKLDIPESAYRMFRYYLLSCAGSFRARDMQLWQIVLSPGGVPGGYIPVRESAASAPQNTGSQYSHGD